MKTSTRTTVVSLLAAVALITSTSVAFAQETKTLKEALKDKFLIGTAVNTRQASGQDKAGVRVIQEQFNAIVAENCMKSQEMHPKENRYNFTQADEFVAFGEKNHLAITGHTLIWHSQLSPWFCVDENGKNVSPEVLKKRMKDHITTIVKRYKGRIKGWDVVNEAIEEPFLKICEEIRFFLDRIPPQIYSNIADEGVFLIGGTTKIPGVGWFISQEVRIRVRLSKYHDLCTIYGIKEIIGNKTLWKWVK